ncbi:MAG: peptidyl-prolyl cis-trans isomerase [Candidatus Micrarchaeota archaeon]|nr:peptidyl-prolyl cis-trans isomerase [Candidatus Micrarchaeota archaeon]
MGEKIRCAHILVEKLSLAEEILKKLKEGGNFSQLAEQYSIDGSRRRGGDLGEFGRGMMVKPFEDAAFALQKGEISGIVKTQFGYHIIKRIG